ncbi:MAG: hypothetical protein HOE73_07250 [Bacteroidetes Order II. Incertae sedis bacterium]|jgi:competence protein CoiA|nr:hypothetical protein [Bacteroidetes Order II. bacterium]
MEFSYVDGQRRVAEPDLKGVCDMCGGEMVPKCGKIRIHHWAHRRGQDCDPWSGKETEWHREWKQEFPEHCREVTVTSDDDEKHRADVKTDSGLVIEFQHSPIKLEDRQIREAFYKDMVWVVDGLRVLKSFDKQIGLAKALDNTPIKLRVPKGSCSILKTWADSMVDVYLDFGDTKLTDSRYYFSRLVLWRLFPGSSETLIEMAPVWRRDFIDAALNGSSPKGVDDPKMTVMSKPQKSKFNRQKSETDIEYSLRVWGIDN